MTVDSHSPAPPTLVRKYGGSSLASVDRLRDVARALAAKRAQGHQLVVVVSAMGRTTDELLRLAHQVAPQPPRRELDMLLSVGERITMSLLSMALIREGCSAISYTGSQVGIITDASHTDARIIEVRADRIRASLREGHVVVVAGFQGVSVDREITTLGRGGSDTTAVALAAALGALRCEILKDVDGVFTADPHKVFAARRYDHLSYEQMLEIAEAGCGVLHARAVEYAQQHGVPLLIASSFGDGPGTAIGPRAPTDDPGAQPCRWRPLALDVREDVALCELCGDFPDGGAAWSRRLARATAPETLLAEWVEQGGREFRWGAVGDPEAMGRIHAALAAAVAADGGQLRFLRGQACVSVAGTPRGGGTAAREALAQILESCGAREWLVRADHAVIRLLMPSGDLPRLLAPLHAALFPA